MESPDFEQIAEQWCFNEETDTVPEMEARRAEFVVVLKSVWNARGAADLRQAEDALQPPRVDIIAVEARVLAAIRSLDR